MNTLSNAGDVLIFCLCLPLFLPPLHMKEASSEPVRAPVREALLEARAAQVLHPAPREGRILVESPEVSGGGVYMERHAPTSSGLPWEHRLLWRALKSECRLLPPPPHLGVSVWIRFLGGVWGCKCTSLHACAGTVLSGMFLTGLLLTSLLLSRSLLSALWKKQMTDLLGLNQHSAGLSEARRGATVKSSPHVVTQLVCHQGHVFTVGPLSLKESMFTYRLVFLFECILPTSYWCCCHH